MGHDIRISNVGGRSLGTFSREDLERMLSHTAWLCRGIPGHGAASFDVISSDNDAPEDLTTWIMPPTVSNPFSDLK